MGARRGRDSARRRQPPAALLATAMTSRSIKVMLPFSLGLLLAAERQNSIAASGMPRVAGGCNLAFSMAASMTPSRRRAAAVSFLKEDKPRINIGISQGDDSVLSGEGPSAARVLMAAEVPTSRSMFRSADQFFFGGAVCSGRLRRDSPLGGTILPQKSEGN